MSYRISYKPLARAVLSKFPYSLFYTIDGDQVIVLSVFHQNRDPVSFIES